MSMAKAIIVKAKTGWEREKGGFYQDFCTIVEIAVLDKKVEKTGLHVYTSRAYLP